jgi:hypothetical protein
MACFLARPGRGGQRGEAVRAHRLAWRAGGSIHGVTVFVAEDKPDVFDSLDRFFLLSTLRHYTEQSVTCSIDCP